MKVTAPGGGSGAVSGTAGIWSVDASGHLVPATDNGKNIGDATHQVATVYAGTALVAPKWGDGTNFLLKWDSPNGVVALRNAADSAFRQVEAGGVYVVTSGGTPVATMDANGYITTGDVELGSAGWNGVQNAVNMKSTGGVSWCSTAALHATSDTGLSRNGAGIVQVTDGQASPALRDLTLRNLIATGGVQIKTKAGAPGDGDFTNPADGMLAVDTTNSRLYCRTAGSWKYAALT